jgi:alkanesulfonate monooxygenase
MLELGWYCPSEGDGHLLGTRAAERLPTFEYLKKVAQAAERAGATTMLVPTGAINDSYAPDAPYAESWTTGAALAAVTSRIRLLVAVNPAGISAGLAAHRAETLWEISGGRLAVNLVAGGGPNDGYGHAPLGHAGRYERLETLAGALKKRIPDLPLFLGGASAEAVGLAARVADTYLLWGEPVDQVAGRAAAVRIAADRPIRIGLRVHIVARRSAKQALDDARAIVARAEVRLDRAGEYAAFDSVGQRRMNALTADSDDWVEPLLWAGIRSVRGGAGTALVGSYTQVAERLREYNEAGVDLVIASGYPHLEEVARVSRRVWPRLDA